MSQEAEPAGFELPSRTAYYLARLTMGTTIRWKIDVTTGGFENVPLSNAVMAVSNHRNNKWDVPLLGHSLVGIRTPYYPAKIELNKGINGRIMRGAGALFFKRGDRQEAARLEALMIEHLNRGHMILAMVEGTSKNRGPELKDVKRGALDVALQANLDEIILFGLGGTETGKKRPVLDGEDPAEVSDLRPSRVHIEVGKVPLLPLVLPFRLQEKEVPSKDQKEYMREVIIPTHQQIIDIAYERVAA